MSPGTVTAGRRRSRVHDEALSSFVARLRQDHTIIAAILFGSLAYDDVWEKSDIDIFLITDEEKAANKGYSLVEGGVNIHAVVTRRSEFKKALEGDLGGGMWQSVLPRSKLLFSSDDSIRAYYDTAQRMGSRDRELRLLRAAGSVLPALAKAEKWLDVKGDVDYSFLSIMAMVNGLAGIEVFRQGEVPGREVVAQALHYNPPFFRAIYADFIHQPKDAAAVRRVLDLINAYLDEHLMTLFKPILDVLAAAGGSRTTTELNEHFQQHAQAEELSNAYEWLADKGVLRKVPSPLRLTMKSRVKVDEAAYYYDGGDQG